MAIDARRLESMSPAPGAPQTSHKAWAGAALGGFSVVAGLLVGAMGLVGPEDLSAALGAPQDRVGAWWRIGVALLTVLAGVGATGRTVWAVRNYPLAPDAAVTGGKAPTP